MRESDIVALTARQRDCLRLVRKDCGSGEIATVLQIDIETVESHIKRARQKLGGVSRFAAARALAEYEEHHQSLVTSSLVIPQLPQIDETELAWPESDRSSEARVREARIAFDYSDHQQPAITLAKEDRRNRLTALHRIGLMVAIVFLIALIIIAAPPMSDSFQRIANRIQEPQHN